MNPLPALAQPLAAEPAHSRSRTKPRPHQAASAPSRSRPSTPAASPSSRPNLEPARPQRPYLQTLDSPAVSRDTTVGVASTASVLGTPQLAFTVMVAVADLPGFRSTV